MANKKTFYITTPIFYPSGNLHIGHLYTMTIAWAFRNYKKKLGYETLLLTGADEHGQKIQQKASEAKLEPQQYVDKMSSEFIQLWKDYGLDHDIFYRTTNKGHIEAVQKIFSQLSKQKEIYLGKYTGLYSISDEEFLTTTQAKRSGSKYYHPTSGHELKEINEESYFLKIKNHKKWLLDLVKNNEIVFPESTRKELISNFIENELTDLSVTRTNFSWGIKPIINSNHIIYVWLDALSNYITALGYNSVDKNELFKKFWKNGDEIVHIIGKEIARFHCIYWPIILKDLNLKQPTRIQAHGWITTPTGKMSKSKNNVVNPYELLEEFAPETIKYFLLRTLRFDRDSVFDSSKIVEVYNADLANTYGNLISRTISLFKQNFEELKITKTSSLNQAIDKELMNNIDFATKQYHEQMNEYDINSALETIIVLGNQTNLYFDKTEPWKLKENKERLTEILDLLLNSIYALSAMLEFILPTSIKKVAEIFNLEEFDFNEISNSQKFKNITIRNQDNYIIFKRK